MAERYTAADFANAQFAEHPDGKLAHRKVMGPDRHIRQWTTTGDNSNGQSSDANMARDGWVPVPTKPTITNSEYQFYESESGAGNISIAGLLNRLGIEIIPDPEPTNTDKLKDILYSKGSISEYQATIFAQHLDAHGVTAPKED